MPSGSMAVLMRRMMPIASGPEIEFEKLLFEQADAVFA